MDNTNCFHCGDPCDDQIITYKEKSFCCHGCKTVFDIFDSNDLSYYYEIQAAAGSSPIDTNGKYEYLDTPSIADKLLEFNDGNHQIINLYIPSIHCSSCIWILENLHKIASGIIQSQVDFPKKTVRVNFEATKVSLKEVVLLLATNWI